MLRDPRAIYDGFDHLPGGMNGGIAPSRLPPTQVAYAENVTFRGGYPMTRPGWDKHTLDAPEEFLDGLFQGAFGFSSRQGHEELLSSVSGRIYRMVESAEGWSVSELPGELRNPANRPKAWFVDAEGFVPIQDGQSSALIYDGAQLRRENPQSEKKGVPVGTAMEYAQGRLWVVRPDERTFVAGDLAYSDSGTTGYNFRDSVLKFSENQYLAGGGEFGTPFSNGRIRAMKALASLDTSLGQGPLQVGTDNGMFGVDAPFDRLAWSTLRYPIKSTSLIGSGPVSQESGVIVNGDYWFRSPDGIRSFQIARRDFGTWVNTPLSSEVESIIRSDCTHYCGHASAALFDNRFICTTRPRMVADHGVVWEGVVALDFHNVSGIGVRTAPVWEGVWTGLRILQLVPLGQRLFMFCLDADDQITLWEQSRESINDKLVNRIAARIHTRSHFFEDNGFARKELDSGDLWIDDMRTDLDLDVRFRPDQYGAWVAWHSWSSKVMTETCGTGCVVPRTLAPQYRTRRRLPSPSDECNPKADSPFRYGFEFSQRIAWTGHARLKKLRVVARIVDEDVGGHCEPTEAQDSTGMDADCLTSTYNADES